MPTLLVLTSAANAYPDVSAETIVFSIKGWFGHNSETAEIASTSKENILREILYSFGIDESQGVSASSDENATE